MRTVRIVVDEVTVFGSAYYFLTQFLTICSQPFKVPHAHQKQSISKHEGLMPRCLPHPSCLLALSLLSSATSVLHLRNFPCGSTAALNEIVLGWKWYTITHQTDEGQGQLKDVNDTLTAVGCVIYLIMYEKE